MEIACNVTRQAPIAAELVNLATPRWRQGRPVRPREPKQLASAFAELVGVHTGAAVRAVPDAGERLGALAGGLRHALLAEDAGGRAAGVNALIERYGSRPYLTEDVGQPFHLHFHGSGETVIESLGGEFATAIALIIDGYGADRFGQCQAERCEAVYVDLTRNGSRRYCSTQCTARAKSAAYRSKTPKTTGATAPAATKRWLEATWPFIAEHLPPAPASVLEIGCGRFGGFVPALQLAGYQALGVDPEAPQRGPYQRGTFEEYEPPTPVHAIVACTSLHHVTDLHDVLDHVESALQPGGVFIVVEWAHERFDEATATWCFDRLANDSETGWLLRHRELWNASGHDWSSYIAAWSVHERMHAGHEITRALRSRFQTRFLGEGPYFFSDLDNVSETDEQDAIDTGQIQATGIRYVGHKPR
ncbi:MAG: CGNR zinc finger domain-containing protein [Geodermatophilaceae bacterium]|nr:CGNR zinc finger domain-containing protein [Geodermatophilaceae bacterium]